MKIKSWAFLLTDHTRFWQIQALSSPWLSNFQELKMDQRCLRALLGQILSKALKSKPITRQKNPVLVIESVLFWSFIKQLLEDRVVEERCWNYKPCHFSAYIYHKMALWSSTPFINLYLLSHHHSRKKKTEKSGNEL